MWKYLVWKITLSIISIFIITAIFYFAYTSIHPRPFSGAGGLKESDILKKEVSAGIRHGSITAPGELLTVFERYAKWISGVFVGNFGIIFDASDSKTIPQSYFPLFKTSMYVSIPSFFLGMFIGLGLGTWAGYKRGKLTDQIINAFVIIFIAMPTFVLGALALLIGPRVNLPTVFESSVGTPYMIKSLILPICVATLLSLASWMKIMRMEVGNILVSDYILAARTKGYSEWFIFKRYVLRNALYPFIGAIATSFMAVFGSSIIIERFFNVGGISTLLMESMGSGEVNIVMFNMSFMLVLGVFTQVISDLALFTINPVVRASFSSKTSPIAKIKFAMMRKRNDELEKKAVVVGGSND